MSALLTPLRIDDATRRQFLAGLAAAGLLAGCGTNAATPAVEAPAGRWSFTDDVGATIELDAPPQRVVAFSSAAGGLWDLGVRPVGVWGPHRLPDGSPDPQVGDVDLGTVESVSAADPYEVNLEALAALRPDLIVAPTFTEGGYSAFTDDVVERVAQIAPIVGISHVGKPFDQVLARWVELAAALGADLDAPAVVQDRRRFDAAVAALREATAAKPGLTSMFVAASSDVLYVVHPRADSPVWFFDEQGLGVVVPDVPVTDYWETLSWEQVGKYPVDLIFHSVRSDGMTLDQYLAQPTFAALPAAESGQLAPWRLDAPISHRRYAPIIEEITTAVNPADPTLT